MGPPSRKGTYYGPSPDTLFKITHTPGKITMVDRAVTREVNLTNTDKLSRRGSALFQSLRRYGSRNNDDNDTHSVSSPSSESPHTSYFTSQSCNDLYQSAKSNIAVERHPLQFICSVATKNLINLHFEAESPEEKDVWCLHMESVLGEHVQRNYTQAAEKKIIPAYKQATTSPTTSTYSFESVSSSESLVFPSSWTGYCDVEYMDIDEVEQSAPFSVSSDIDATQNNITDKSQDILQTIIGEFGDNIWNVGAPPGMSPFQLRKTFSDIGSHL